MKFIAAGGKLQQVAAAQDKGVLWDVVEKGRDVATESMADVTMAVLANLGGVMKGLGLWLLQVAPDSLIIMAMIFCLGAIASIPRAGNWAVISTVAAVVAECLRGSVFGA